MSVSKQDNTTILPAPEIRSSKRRPLDHQEILKLCSLYCLGQWNKRQQSSMIKTWALESACLHSDTNSLPHLTSLCLRFPSCKMRKILSCALQYCYNDETGKSTWNSSWHTVGIPYMLTAMMMMNDEWYIFFNMVPMRKMRCLQSNFSYLASLFMLKTRSLARKVINAQNF